MENPATSREIRVHVLLEEYRSLRDESRQGMGDRIALLGFLTVATALVIANHEAVWAMVVAVLLLAIPAGVWYRTWRGLDKRAQHLADLEQRPRPQPLRKTRASNFSVTSRAPTPKVQTVPSSLAVRTSAVASD